MKIIRAKMKVVLVVAIDEITILKDQFVAALNRKKNC